MNLVQMYRDLKEMIIEPTPAEKRKILLHDANIELIEKQAILERMAADVLMLKKRISRLEKEKVAEKPVMEVTGLISSSAQLLVAVKDEANRLIHDAKESSGEDAFKSHP